MRRTVVRVLAALCCVVAAWISDAGAQPPNRGRIDSLLEKLQIPGPGAGRAAAPFGAAGTVAPPEYALTPAGYVRNLAASRGTFFRARRTVPGRPEMTARNFVMDNAEAFGLTPDMDLVLRKSRVRGRRSHHRFRQTFRGIRIFGAEILVRVNDHDGVEYVASDIARHPAPLESGALSLVPTISAAEGGRRARMVVQNEEPGRQLVARTPTLAIFDPSVLGAPGTISLVWETEIRTAAGNLSWRVLVDAHSGEAVRNYPGQLRARNRRIYDANNSTSDPGTLERSEGDVAAGITEVDNAYDALGDTYDFYQAHHGRDSMNDAGITINATVRYCDDPVSCPMPNAFFASGNRRIYVGDGYAVDDVLAHEYTHGVTHFESGLIYENHSGAINESLSDVWGEFVDLGNGSGTDTAAVRWEIGEDLPNGAIRSMSDPLLFGDPDRMGSPNFVAPVANPSRNNDYGGVHTNSGVNNKLCFLLTDGDTFNGQTVRGFGVARVADLYYETAVHHLTATSDYTDLYYALLGAAADLGWSDDDLNNLYRACLAVEIAVGGRDIYVDGDHTGPAAGTLLYPYTKVSTGYSVAFPGDRLWIKRRAAGYDESPLHFGKILDVRVYGSGTEGAHVGRP